MRLLKQSQTAQPLMFMMTDSTDHLSPKTGLTPTVTISKNGAAFASPAGAVSEVGSGWYKVAGNATDTATLGPLVLHATATGADVADVEYAVVAFDPQVAYATQTSLDTVDDFLDTEIAAIKVKTDNLPASPANEATLTTIATYIDTEVAAILTAVDTEVAAIKAKTDSLTFTVAGEVNANARYWVGGAIATPTITGVPEVDVTHTLGSAASPFEEPIDANVTQWKGVTAATVDASGYPVVTLKDGSGQGELLITSGQLDGVNTILGYIDTEIAAILATVDTEVAAIKAKTDNLPASPANEATLMTIAGYIDTEVSTILNRLGAFTGSGINTVLGCFRAIFNKAAALTPTDLSTGGTGDNTTDSLEALRDRGDAAWLTGVGSDTAAIASAVAAALAGQFDLTVVAPYDGVGLDLYRFDAWQNSEGRGITVTKQSTETHWPTTLNTVHLHAKPTARTLLDTPAAASLTDIACTVTQATGANQAFRLELTTAQMGALQAGANGYSYWFIANQGTHDAVLRSGPFTVRPDPTA